MKNLILVTFAILALAVVAIAAEPVKQVTVPAIAATGSSAVIKATGYVNKTVHVTGSDTGITFMNFSGTGIVECAPTTSGPWSTCAQEDGTAISFTAPGNLSWTGLSDYIRVTYTKSKHSLKAWLTLRQ